MAHESNQFGDTDVLHPHYEMKMTRDNRGFWSGTQVYYCYKPNLATLAPAEKSVHPDYPFMFVEGLEVTGEEADWLRLEAGYTGVLELNGDGEDSSNEPTYTLDLGLSEEPLELHGRYVAGIANSDIDVDDVQTAVRLAKNPKVDDDGAPVAVDTTGWPALKVELYDFVRQGFESFKDPKVTWTKEWVSDERPDNLNEIGEIFSPDGSPPAIAAGRNWLFGGLRSIQRGVVFENSQVAELSGRGGWNTTIYG